MGTKNEKPGRTGFAHLFEHMMFKGSKNVEPEAHTSIIASVGGQSNAYTNEDTTVFWQTLPSQYLPLSLWLEADRMATLRIDQQVFVLEREVVGQRDGRIAAPLTRQPGVEQRAETLVQVRPLQLRESARNVVVVPPLCQRHDDPQQLVDIQSRGDDPLQVGHLGSPGLVEPCLLQAFRNMFRHLRRRRRPVRRDQQVLDTGGVGGIGQPDVTEDRRVL